MMPKASGDAISPPSLRLPRRGKGLPFAWLLSWVLLGLLATPAQSSPEMDTPPYPFTPTHLGRAWEAAGDRDLLLGLGAGALATLLVYPLDDEISDWFYEQAPLGPGAYDLGREMGHRKYVAWVSLGLAGGGLLLGNRHIRDTGALYLEANLITAAFTQLFKATVGRVRPDGSNDHSFPSGHASATMASARVLQMRFGWWVGAPAYAAATFVGLSRIQGKKHYPSDVIFGWAVGFYIASTVVRATEPRGAANAREDAGVAKGTQLSWLPTPSFSDPGLPLVHLDF